jgi:uncharacterized protein (DUF58 family)
VETNEILRKVRKIEIKTRGLTNQIFAGEYHSAFKGKGMSFSEVREYQYGDDVRNIDWNVTARFNRPYVKVFEEERELTVILAIDVSRSGDFGTNKQLKRDLITEVAAVLSFSAIQNNDKVGVIFFSNKIEKFIPPKKGKKHILRIIRELIDFEAEGKGTDITEALRFVTNSIKKRSIVFVLSDFFDDNSFEKAIRIASNKHDLIALQIADQREEKLPQMGLVKFEDPETGEEIWIDTSMDAVRKEYEDFYKNHEQRIKEIFARANVDTVKLYTGKDFVVPLMNLFKMRTKFVR